MTSAPQAVLKDWLEARGFSEGINPFESKGDAAKEQDELLETFIPANTNSVKDFISSTVSAHFVAEKGSGKTTVARMLKLCRQLLPEYSRTLVINLELKELDKIELSNPNDIKQILVQNIMSALQQWQSPHTPNLCNPGLVVTLEKSLQTFSKLGNKLNLLIEEIIQTKEVIGLEFVIDGLEAASLQGQLRCKKFLALLNSIAALNKKASQPKVWVKVLLSPEVLDFFKGENQPPPKTYLMALLKNKYSQQTPIEEILRSRLDHFSTDQKKIGSLAQLSKISDLDRQLCKAAKDTPQLLIEICYNLLEQHFWDTRHHPAFLQQKIGWKSLKRTFRKMNHPVKVERQIFVSYSHQDRKWLERLKPHLQAIANYSDLTFWIDQNRIKAGEKWSEEIEKAISDSPVTLLLCSKHFFASDYIRREELPAILDAKEHNESEILILNIGPSLLSGKIVQEELKKLRLLQHLLNPDKGRYLMELATMVEVEQALVEAAEAILETMNQYIVKT